MKASNHHYYQPAQFARLTGVTVRALHHYDRLGLLRPASRTASGYRLYSPADVVRLQQIVTLKFIGFSLRQIKRLITSGGLVSALRAQRAVLEQKRRGLDQAITAIADAERALGKSRAADWTAFATIIKRIQMQNENDWVKKYYNEEAQKQIASRQHLWSPEFQKKAEKDWMELHHDVRAAIARGIQPHSADGQQLAARQEELVRGFSGGHPAVEAGLKQLWRDVDHLPQVLQEKLRPFVDDQVSGFLQRAGAARRRQKRRGLSTSRSLRPIRPQAEQATENSPGWANLGAEA